MKPEIQARIFAGDGANDGRNEIGRRRRKSPHGDEAFLQPFLRSDFLIDKVIAFENIPEDHENPLPDLR
ncbi:hypothetical protein D3C71_1585120 [compost metagenome]